MNAADIVQLVSVVKTLWPNWSTAPTSQAELQSTIDTWSTMVCDLDSRVVAAAVQALASEGREFPPPIGLIRKRAVEVAAKASGTSVPDVDQAWLEVQSAIQRHGFRGENRPPWSHPAVAGIVESIGWRELCYSDNAEALRAHFMRMYGTVSARADVEQAMPPAVRQLVALAGAKLHLGDGS